MKVITDADLNMFRAEANWILDGRRPSTDREIYLARSLSEVVAEVRRLRSDDDWLLRAAKGVAGEDGTLGQDFRLLKIVEILRKHRDGKA
jgi:hypothetical protein